MTRRLVLALLLCALPAFAQTPNPRFAVASVRPSAPGSLGGGIRVQGGGRYSWTNVTLKQLMATAYSSGDAGFREIIGGPGWIDSARFDVVAKTEEGARVVDADGLPSPLFAMLRNVLEERFRLKVHRETRQRPIYALAMARSDARPGPRLVQAPVDCAAVTRDSAAAKPLPTRADGAPLCAMRITSGQLLGSAIGMPQLASALSTITGQPVVDRTGLAGVFDVTVEFRPDFQPPSSDAPVTGDRPPATDAPSIFTAVQEQLGLKLESTRGPVDVLVVDHAEKPSDN
jgi:uncharacterized protein (TIGR03435 family)